MNLQNQKSPKQKKYHNFRFTQEMCATGYAGQLLDELRGDSFKLKRNSKPCHLNILMNQQYQNETMRDAAIFF